MAQAVQINFSNNWISPAFYWAVHRKARYKVFKGSRASGKSWAIAKILVFKCLTNGRFKCVYARKIKDKIRKSCFSRLKETIRNFGLDDLFVIKEGDMTITALNGNSFIAVGFDDPDNVKSVDDPTHVWFEEADQFEEFDFQTMDTSLRGPKGLELEFYMSFNPMNKFHWLYDTFFVDERSDVLLSQTTFRDNIFIDQEEYHSKLLKIRDIDENLYNVWANGEWGIPDYSKLFMKNYRKDQHLSTDIIFNPDRQLLLSWDFNVNNSALISQEDDHNIFRLKEYRNDHMDIQDICTEIINDMAIWGYSPEHLLVTGDASGGNRSGLTRGNKNAFEIIGNLMSLGEDNFSVVRANPGLNSSRVFSNILLKNEPAYLINPDTCPELIKDIEMAPWPDTDFKKWKTDNLDRSHMLDTMRYDDWNFHRWRLDSYTREMLEEKELI